MNFWWDDIKEFFTVLIPFFVIVVLITIVIGFIGWYGCGVQAESYRKQGVNITQKELFFGAQPLKRNISIDTGSF